MALRGDEEIDSLLSIMGGGDGSTLIASADSHSAHKDAKKKSEKKDTKKKSEKKDAKKKSEKKDAKKRSEKRSKKRRLEYKNAENSRCVSFAGSRLSQNCFHWPQSDNGHSHLSLGAGLAHDCKGYIIDSSVAICRYGSTRCKNCGRSSSAHELCISIGSEPCNKVERTSPTPLAAIIVAARNARCVMGEYHVPSPASKSKHNKSLLSPVNSMQSTGEFVSKRLDLFTGRVLAELKNMSTQIHDAKSKSRSNAEGACIPTDDFVLLKEKVATMAKSIAEYKKTITTPYSDVEVTNQRIEAMAMCDTIYYRCYYSSITCFGDSGGNSGLQAMIPHPPTYFSCPGLAWDTLESGSKALDILLGHSNMCENTAAGKHDDVYAAPLDANTRKLLLESWGLKSRLDSGKEALCGNTINPLLLLWQSRFLETLRHIWATGYSLAISPLVLQADTSKPKSDTNSKESNQLQLNETVVISSSVSIWRDSIRDYPANFYAYACPTERSLDLMLSHLESLPKNGVAIEAGAGTGYWSALINSISDSKSSDVKKQKGHAPLVVPYDIAPPSQMSSNEYHGLIPTFTEVKRADSLEQTREISSGSLTSTLILCYPPPASDMALAALSTHSPRTLIHIGEWQGLTGNDSFEQLLTQNFYCNQSELLPCWGTDATYLTIWERKVQRNDASVFSPAFGYCSSQPCSNLARRRCKFARCLQYCSHLCFEKDDVLRRAYLAMHMMQLPVNSDVNFDSDNHFIEIQSGEHVTKKRKKKRKKQG